MGYSLNGVEIPKRVGVYEIQYPLGEGGSSIVFFARNIQTFENYALKFVSRQSLNNIAFLENFEKELRIFSRINHKNIAKYYETIYTPDFIIIVQEALTGGTLATVSNFNAFHSAQETYLRWAKEILEAICYLHSIGISHGDIKPENIGFDAYNHPKLFDFGLSSDHTRTKTYKCGTPMYSAPEVFRTGQHDDFKADIWSYGVTMHYILTRSLPFKMDSIKSFLKHSNDPDFLSIKVTGVFKDLMAMTLAINPKDRLSAAEILKSPIFINVDTKDPYENNLWRNNRCHSDMKRCRSDVKNMSLMIKIYVPKVASLSKKNIFNTVV